MLRGLTRNFHVVTRSIRSEVAKEEPVAVYSSPYAAQFKKASSDADHFLAKVQIDSGDRVPYNKCLSLIPFFAEAAITKKRFVTKMNLYPEAKVLGLECLTLDGVQTLYLPIDLVVPITKYDYWCASWRFWTKQNPIIDLDMIYANRVTKEMYVFEKEGTWHDEGVHHEALSMEATYNEHHWYDMFNVSRL